jgi:hypothetical protein
VGLHSWTLRTASACTLVVSSLLNPGCLTVASWRGPPKTRGRDSGGAFRDKALYASNAILPSLNIYEVPIALLWPFNQLIQLPSLLSAAMPTQSTTQIPLAHAPDGRGYTLIELPAELVEMLETAAPPVYAFCFPCLSPSLSPTKTDHVD